MRPFVEGAPTTVFSDHKPLKFINSASNKNAKLQRWATRISGFGAEIKYLEGKFNVNADLLSRAKTANDPDTQRINDILEVSYVDNSQIQDEPDASSGSDSEEDEPEPVLVGTYDIVKEQKADRSLSKVRDSLSVQRDKSKFYSRYVVENDVLYYVTKDEDKVIVVPKSLRMPLLQELHDKEQAHLGRDKLISMLKSRYFWKGMYRMASDFVSSCVACNTQKLHQIPAPLEEMETPRFPFQKVGVDTVGPFPESEEGYKYCLTVTDFYTSWIEVFPMKDKSAVTVCKLLLEEIFKRFSWPRVIVSDNGSEFCNQILEQLHVAGHIHGKCQDRATS